MFLGQLLKSVNKKQQKIPVLGISFDSRNTFEVTHSKEMGWFSEYISEHMYLRHGLDLEHYKHYSLILYPGEMSAIRNEHTLSPLSNYTAIYGVDVPKNSTEQILNNAIVKLFNTYLYRAKTNSTDESLITE